MALRLLPPAVSPSPAPVCPPGHYKRMRSTPRPSPHSPHPQLLTSESTAPTPPSVPHHRPVVSDPPPPSLAAGEAHLRPLHFSSTVVRFRARGRRSGRSPASLPWDGDCGPPWTGATRGPWARGLGPRISFRKIIPGNSNFGHFALRPLCFFKINPQSNQL
jgi:hypothetical protein